jgi:hypothetical protein
MDEIVGSNPTRTTIKERMKMELFLAQFEVHTTAYMGQRFTRQYIRLVRADNHEEAEAKIRDKFGDKGEIGDSRAVFDLVISNIIE